MDKQRLGRDKDTSSRRVTPHVAQKPVKPHLITENNNFSRTQKAVEYTPIRSSQDALAEDGILLLAQKRSSQR